MGHGRLISIFAKIVFGEFAVLHVCMTTKHCGFTLAFTSDRTSKWEASEIVRGIAQTSPFTFSFASADFAGVSKGRNANAVTER